MNSLVVVAIPTEDDYVNKISSQKVPHLTILYLGEDAAKVDNVPSILDFCKHASKISLERFGLDVDRRGELGEDPADVLFFAKNKYSGYPLVHDFRSYLLKDDNIRKAFDAAEQHDEWIPHLTLGYPDSPAKPDNRDYPGINYVSFDRIAVWFGEFEGIEWRLKAHEWESEVAWGEEFVEGLMHFGTKGMRWGVRRDKSSKVTVTDKGKRLKTSGGHGHKADPSAVRARKVGQKAKASGLKALSDDELAHYARRLQLEQNVKRLQWHDKPATERFVRRLLGQSGSVDSHEANSQLVRKTLKKIVIPA